MKYLRTYAGPDGESHFEDIEVEFKPSRADDELSDLIAANGFLIRKAAPGQFINWHPAPRRQFVITISGEAEIEVSDGEVRQIGPGTIMLADDTTGRGHITRGIGNGERISIFVTLPQ